MMKNQIHVSINGGRDNIVENNVMYNATSYAIHVDGRGTGHSRDKYLIPHLNVRLPFTLYQTKWKYKTNVII